MEVKYVTNLAFCTSIVFLAGSWGLAYIEQWQFEDIQDQRVPSQLLDWEVKERHCDTLPLGLGWGGLSKVWVSLTNRYVLYW